MDNEAERNRRYAETTDRIYFALMGLGLSSVGVLWSMLLNELIGG
jgi:hypothetical protein